MPTHKQTTVEAVTTARDKGSSDSSSLKASFPGSPIHNGDMTEESVRADFEDKVLNGQVNDGGHTFGTFDRDYTDAPDLQTVETGGGGLPASPYVPNPASPGEGSVNPADMPEPPEGFGENPSDSWGTGEGSQANPARTSAEQSKSKLGDFVAGKAWGSGT